MATVRSGEVRMTKFGSTVEQRSRESDSRQVERVTRSEG